jgi:membrane protein DedA with SNARE-associated domain
MIWLAVNLAVGGLLAQRFRIFVLAPATFVMVVIAITAGVAQTNSGWSVISMIATASVGIQIGYFLGILIQRCGASLLSRRSARFFRRGRNTTWVSRTPIL